MKRQKYAKDTRPAPEPRMEVISIVSEHKKRSGRQEAGYTYAAPAHGKKRVQAIVRLQGKGIVTRHIDIPK